MNAGRLLFAAVCVLGLAGLAGLAHAAPAG